MVSIILFILLWGSSLADWAKILLTALWIFEKVCTSSVANNASNEVKTKKKSKKE